MAEHNDRGEYNNDTPKKVAVGDNNGYPNPKPNTKTRPMRGTGAATKGLRYSKFSD